MSKRLCVFPTRAVVSVRNLLRVTAVVLVSWWRGDGWVRFSMIFCLLVVVFK